MHIMLSTYQYLSSFDQYTDEHIYCTVTIFRLHRDHYSVLLTVLTVFGLDLPPFPQHEWLIGFNFRSIVVLIVTSEVEANACQQGTKSCACCLRQLKHRCLNWTQARDVCLRSVVCCVCACVTCIICLLPRTNKCWVFFLSCFWNFLI